MGQKDIKPFLNNMKLIYQHGLSHSKNKSKLHRLLAIHNCHYVVEQIVREHAKNMSFDMTFNDALHKIDFEHIVLRVHNKENIPDCDRLLELNRIRNDAEHFFIIPDIETVQFYMRTVGYFLKWSYKGYFGVDYELLAFEDLIYGVPIKKVMLEVKDFIEKNDLPSASKKMYEALGAFKFAWFGFLADPRLETIVFENDSLANILADLAFKIILSEDESTLTKFMGIRTTFKKQNGKVVGVQSVYPQPTFKNKEDAMEHYEHILDIILTCQERIPMAIWESMNKSL